MLITFLGKVSAWKNAKYKLNSKEFENNNYLSEILNYFDENDILVVITESLLNSKNEEKEIISDLIVNLYKNFFEKDLKKEEIIKNLKKENINNLEKFQGNKRISFLIIKDDDTQQILDELKKKLDNLLTINKGNIYLDITHSYRYLPVLIMFALDILRNLENLDISIKEIIYAKQTNNDKDEYEIKTLRDLKDLDKLNKAVEDFHQKGILQNIANLYIDKGKEFDIKSLEKLGKALKELDFYLNLNILEEINTGFDNVSNILDEIDKDDLEFPLNIIHNDIKEFIEEFTEESKISKKQLGLAKWHLKNDRLLLGLIALQESIRSKHMEKDNISNVFDFNERKRYSFPINKILKELGANENNKFNCCLDVLNKEENKYIKYWCFLTNLRNAGGHNLAEGEKQEQIKNIRNCKEKYENFLKKLKNEEFVEELYEKIDLSPYK